MSKLLEIKKRMKKKKPDFIRQDAHKRVKLGSKWRRPKGSDSKVRIGFKGYRRKVKVGYGTPDALRHSDVEGKKIILVNNLTDLESAAQNTTLILSSKMGMRKKVALIKKAQELKKSFANLDSAKYLENVKKKLEERKKAKEKLNKDKEKKQKEAKPKKTIEEKVEISEEDQKKAEKEEKDKVLRQGYDM